MRRLPRYLLFDALFLLAVLLAPGCRRGGTADGAEDVKVDLTLDPDPPRVGMATANVRLTGKDGKPIGGATVKLEGNMSHAGMKPVFGEAKEKAPGKYEAPLNFTMGGDWFIIINATLPDGRKLTRQVDIAGVKSK